MVSIRELENDCHVCNSQSFAGSKHANVVHLPHNTYPVSDKQKDDLETVHSHQRTHLSPVSCLGGISQATTAQNTPHMTDNRGSLGFRSTEIGLNHSQTEKNGPESGSKISSVCAASREGQACPTEKEVLDEKWSWPIAPILVLAIYSTMFSGLFLGIALARPRWGDQLGTNGHVSYATATFLSTLFSKTVELSFVSVFVALLGQILSRRAVATITRTSTGVNIVEMNMRSWITQPENLLVHWTNIRYGATTVLGMTAIVATIAAMFYTSATQALVAPKLKFGPMEDRLLAGKVSAAFANSIYIRNNCETPFPDDNSNSRGNACLDVEHSGQSYHNLRSFFTSWADIVATGNTSRDPGGFDGRPNPIAMLHENTTVFGEWITPSQENITRDSSLHQRLVQNVTMAMPHANIFSAARDLANHILQPDDPQGVGEYVVKASVPAPSINILCVGLSREELNPLIHNASRGPAQAEATAVDDLFLFSKKYGRLQQPAPYFMKVPKPYNTIVNHTTNFGPSSIYMLATPPPDTPTNDHILCGIKAMQYPNCTTIYHAAKAGGLLSAHCDKDRENIIPYLKSEPKAPIGKAEQNWKDVGSEWSTAIGLNSGALEANSSNARLVTQMIPKFDTATNTVQLDSSLPSIGEALAVLAGGTLLLSSANAPFIHHWNYSDSVSYLKVPQYQRFNATISYKDYASGGTQRWQGVFYVVLVAVFLLNSFALVYLTWIFGTDGQVTDYMEPANLFALAINSPSSMSMRGTCGGGPRGEVMGKKWQIEIVGDEGPGQNSLGPRRFQARRPHYYIKCLDDDDDDQRWTEKSQCKEK